MNTNYLSPIGFTVAVSRLPHVEFFTQKAFIPGVTLEAPQLANPMGNLFVAGDRLAYQDLDLSFLADENMTNYMLFQALRSLMIMHHWKKVLKVLLVTSAS